MTDANPAAQDPMARPPTDVPANPPVARGPEPEPPVEPDPADSPTDEASPVVEVGDLIDPDEDDEDKLVIDLDLGSFKRSERKALQQQFGQNFEALIATVRNEIWSNKPSGEVLIASDGSPIFADEVMIALLTTVQKRTDPDATDSDFDDLSLEDLMMAVVRGRQHGPKDSTSST